jgi:DNA ligase-1
MKLSKLYKRAVNGKTLEWEIEVNGECFRTISGYTDGIKTTSEWTCCEAKNVGKKNATTANEQALAEATAMHRKRIETGSFEDITKIDTPVYFKPMLAHDYNDYKDKITFPIYSQPKLDGVRCIVRSDGMWSRNGKPIISAPHIFESLKFLFEANPDLILDGELYADKLNNDFNTIISLVRKTKPTQDDLDKSAELIEYHIYDIPSYDQNFFARNNKLRVMELHDKVFKDTKCKVVDTRLATDETLLTTLYKQYIEQGYEGQMVRLSAQYENKRSKSLLKRKEFVDAEFTILGVIEGNGNLTGKVGKLQFEINGKPFESAVNGDWEYIEKLWHSREGLVGKTATVKYFELTEDGIPRFPKVIAIRDFE